jgi:hypothetical protein
MNYVLVFRLEARNELDDAYSWYESQQIGLGDVFLEQVGNTRSNMPDARGLSCCLSRCSEIDRTTLSLHYLLSDRIEPSDNYSSLSWK